MKKLTAEEKLAKLGSLADRGETYPATTLAIIECPYGDSSHRLAPYGRGAGLPGSEADACASCSKLDGSECVDEFLEAWDTLGDQFTLTYKGNRAAHAIERMREWRARTR